MFLFRLVSSLHRDLNNHASILRVNNSYFLWVITSSACFQKPINVFTRKSLCFQLPAMIDHGITIVVSPLLALMNNQVAALRAADIPVATINSSTLIEDRNDTTKDLCCGMQTQFNSVLTAEYLKTQATQRPVSYMLHRSWYLRKRFVKLSIRFTVKENYLVLQ